MGSALGHHSHELARHGTQAPAAAGGLARLRMRRAGAGQISVVRRPRGSGPLPDIADHVEESVAVGRVGRDRRRAVVAVRILAPPRERALPGVGHDGSLWCQLIAPRVVRTDQATARRVLPLGLGRQILAGPGGVRHGVLPADVHHRVVRAIPPVAARTVGLSPLRALLPAPPLRPVVQRDRDRRLGEHLRPRHEQVGIGAREVGGIQRQLRHGDVTGLGDEGRELRVRDRVRSPAQVRHLDLDDRVLLRVEPATAYLVEPARHSQQQRALGSFHQSIVSHVPSRPAGAPPHRRRRHRRCRRPP